MKATLSCHEMAAFSASSASHQKSRDAYPADNQKVVKITKIAVIFLRLASIRQDKAPKNTSL